MQKLDEKSLNRRRMILEGGLFKTIVILTLPLAIYNLFNYFYGFIDMMMVSHIGSTEVSSVVFIDQIKGAITAFGAGVAASGTVIVARYYGGDDIKTARKSAGLTFLIAVVISLFVVVLTVGFGPFLLRIFGASSEIIETGIVYYNWNMISTSLMAINSVFIGLEKAKGNTKIILWLNLLVMIVKLGLSALFVYGFGGGINELAFATVIAQGILTILSLYFMFFYKRNIFRIVLKEVELNKELIKDIIILAVPLFFGRFLFSMGKVSVNGLALLYHPYAVGALGIASKLHGILGSFAAVFEESQMSIISQNLGNRNLKRALRTFRITLMIVSTIVIAGIIMNTYLAPYLLQIFNLNEEETIMVLTMFKWERFSIITSGLIHVINGFFLGFKKSSVTFWINIFRLFVFRVPILYLMYLFLPRTYEHVGLIMFISNNLTTLLAFGLWFAYYRKLKLYGYQGMTLYDEDPLKIQ